jgi:hypothetical protein
MYFKNFQKALYSFGTQEAAVVIQDFSKHAILTEEAQDDVTIYETYTILQDERPDTLSYRLYGTSEYYWTFFLVNDKLKESGWPLGRNALYELGKKNYPHRAIRTTTNIGETNFKRGVVATGSQSGSTGVIKEVLLDIGTIIIDTPDNFNVGENLNVGSGGDAQTCVVTADSTQFDSVHHYKNSDGEYVDIDPHNPDLTGLVPTTNMERLIEFNDDLSNINIISPKLIQRVATQFMSKLKDN